MSQDLRAVPAEHGELPFPNASVWGDLVVTGGHLGDLHPLAAHFETQADQALRSLARTLEEAGSSLDRIMRIECYLASRAHFEEWNAVYGRFFAARRPPRTTLLSGFVLDGLLIEVQAIAVAA